MAKATYSVDDEEEAAEARKYAAEALRTLAKIADSPTAKPKVREEARRALEARLVHLKSLAENPDTPDHVKRDIETTFREFRHLVSERRFPPPWSAEESEACFIVRDANGQALAYVYFSNRPFWVKRFQTIHHYSVDVARGLALLFGIGTEALPAWD